VQFSTRLVLVVLVLAAVVFAQAAAVVEHQQQETSGHYCLLCHAGPLPLIQASIPLAGAPAVLVGWLPFSRDCAAPCDALLPTASSRAPPRV